MSFEELVNKISPTLKRITHKLNGHFTFFNDEDLYQEALVHLWSDFQEGKLSDKTDSYILQGCYFHLKNYIRKNRDRVCLVSIDEPLDEEGNGLNLEDLLPCQEEKSCRDYIDAKLLWEEIHNDGLTQKEKDVLTLCAEGLTTREIGQRLGISHVRVVKLNSRARHKCHKFKDEF